MIDNLPELMHDIAAELSGQWYVVHPYPDNPRYNLVNDDTGAILSAREEWNKAGRLVITGDHVLNGIRPDDVPRITVNASRPAAAIAADITRRLLPKYAAWIAKLREAYDYQQRRNAANIAAFEAFAAAAGNDNVTLDQLSDGTYNKCYFGHFNQYNTPHGTLQDFFFYDSGPARLRLTLDDLTPDEAIAIYEFLAARRR